MERTAAGVPDRLATSEPTPTPLTLRELASIYRGQYAFVWRCVQRFGVAPANADDATQDVFLRLFTRWRVLDDRSLRGLLFLVARQVATDHHRRMRAQPEPVGEVEWADATALLPDELAGRREAARFLRAFVEALDEDKRRVFVLAELEQCSAPEIAEALAIPLGTVYSRHRAARQQLDAALRRHRARDGGVVGRSRRLIDLARRTQSRPREAAVGQGWLVVCAGIGESRPPLLAAALSRPLLASVGQVLGHCTIAAAVVVGGAALASRTSFADAPAIEVRAPIDGTEPAPVLPPVVVLAPADVPAPVNVPEPVDVLASTVVPAAIARVDATPSPRRARTRAIASSPSPSSQTEQLRAELRWIDGAEARLRAADPAGALRLLDQHAAHFPKGALAPERSLARAHALCRLGRTTEARAELRACLRRHPDLAAHPRARAGCGDDE